MHHVLVINAGSSSMKYQVINATTEERLASGVIERIGEPVGRTRHLQGTARIERDLQIADHEAAFELLLQLFDDAHTPLSSLGVRAVGHRVVHGGEEFVAPTLIDAHVAARILALAELAPLHNPGNYTAILAAQAALPEVPHVAVFDTAFHHNMPAQAYTYAIDQQLAQQHSVRRFGFHGISHQVVSRRAAAALGRPVHELKQVVLHLGNGASMCAIDRGKSVDTSMGLTPLEGLTMGTRSGDIDPGALLHLLHTGMSVDELDTLLNKHSGLIGMAGSNDMRDVRELIGADDHAAQLAFDVYVHRIRKYLGAYLLELNGADAIVFTAGVGEHHPTVRAAVCADLQWFGIELDNEKNETSGDEPRIISVSSSRVAVLVVPTDEEGEIARQVWQFVTDHDSGEPQANDTGRR